MSCRSCRWYDSDDEQLEGHCRAMLPRMAGDIAPGGNASFQRPEQAVWPVVSADDWCKHYAADDTAEQGPIDYGAYFRGGDL